MEGARIESKKFQVPSPQSNVGLEHCLKTESYQEGVSRNLGAELWSPSTEKVFTMTSTATRVVLSLEAPQKRGRSLPPPPSPPTNSLVDRCCRDLITLSRSERREDWRAEREGGRPTLQFRSFPSPFGRCRCCETRDVRAGH